jgi:hypothetical protein
MMKTIAAAALTAGLLAAPAAAQTVGYADAVRILTRSCGADIDRFCREATLADWGITDCLRRNAGRISGQCAGDLESVARSLRQRAEAQRAVFTVCERDAQRLCPMTQRRRGHTLNCLLRAERSVSNRCNQAITNAGWR